MMKLIKLPCLFGGDSCSYETIQLKFSQAKDILEMHMRLVHPVMKIQCESCGKRTKPKDIIEHDSDDEATSCDKPKPVVHESPENVHDNSDKIGDSNEIDVNETQTEEASIKVDTDDVTSVADDRDYDNHPVDEEHEGDKDDKKAIEAQIVEDLFKPVEALHPACRNCGSREHSSQRKIRRRFCPAWDKSCELCGKRGDQRRPGDQT